MINNPKISAILKNLPELPGVYIMRDENDKIIYVGKAKKLKRRVSSYFRHTHASARLNKLVETVRDISIIRTESEAEALIVEAKLIKRYKPFFNIELKMSNHYPFIKITNEDYPKIEITRNQINDGATYLGPFVNVGNIKNLMRLAERYFPLRKCKAQIKPDTNKRPCIEYNLGRSLGACAGLCSLAEYKERVKDIILLFNSEYPELVESLRTKMNLAAKNLKFEEAANYRDAIRAIWKLSRQKISSALQEDLDNATWNVLNDIQKLFGLKVLAWRIDAFDISHTSGHETYGCCVVFEQGRPNKNLYRRFKIKTLADGEIDDFQSMYETVTRRYKRVVNNLDPAPQLALIDGGIVQLEYAKKALDDLNLNIPLVALAKREELLYVPEKDEPIVLDRSSPILQLFQRIRDEVHRFAITTHKNARAKKITHSILDNINGLGSKRISELLIKFGSVQKISELTPEELANADGIGITLAKKILSELKRL